MVGDCHLKLIHIINLFRQFANHFFASFINFMNEFNQYKSVVFL